MTTTEPTQRPTYGNLRRPRRPGLNNLSLLSTGILLLAILVFTMLSIAGVSLLISFGLLIASLVLVGVLQFRDGDGLTPLQRGHRRLAFHRGRRLGQNLYVAGLIGQVPGRATTLPGLAARATLAEGWDSYGRKFAVIHHPVTGDYVAVFAVEPDGSALVDPWVIDDRVAQWGAFLATLGDEPGLQACAVTLETAPDTGHRLRRAVESAIEDDSPQIAQAMLREVVVRYPEGSSPVRGYVTLTFSAATRPGGRKRPTEEIVRDLASRLPKLADRLQFTGASVARPVDSAELCEAIYIGYHPAAAMAIEEAHVSGKSPQLQWNEVGPVGAEARWDHYVHDGAVSKTWQMNRPPRGVFGSNVLADLLAPHHDISRKRVTLLYEVVASDRAAAVVQRDVDDAEFRVTSSPRPSARVRAEADIAQKAAADEAAGAAVVNIGMLVTATVVDPGLPTGSTPTKRNRTREDRLTQALDDAVAAVDSLAAMARIRLRPCYGYQDAAFLASLPLGLNLARHLRLPVEIQEAL